MSGGPATTSAPGTRQPPARRFGRRTALLLLIVSVGVSAALVEAVFRFIVPVTDIPVYFWDPVVGIRRAPNQRGRFVAGRAARGEYRFNAQGWNHPRDYSPARPSGTARVCVVGDSYVEALHVRLDETFFIRAERLMSRPGRPVEWYAFGCSGFGTAQNYNVVRHYALEYRPDVVVLFFTSNDVHDCSPYLTRLEPYVGSFELDATGGLLPIISREYRPSSLRRLGLRSATVRYLWEHTSLLQPRGRRAVLGDDAFREGAELRATGTAANDAEGPQARSWRLIEALLATSKAECEARNAKFVVAFRGCIPRIRAAFEGRPYAPAAREVDPWCLGQRRYEMGREFLGPLCERLDIPYLDLTDALIAEARRTGQRHDFEGDAHFSAVGHAAAARAMADWIEPMLAGLPADTAAGQAAPSR